MLQLPLVQKQYNAYRAGVTTAIVLAILVPVGIALYCLLLYLRARGTEKGLAKGYGGGNFYQQSATRPNITASASGSSGSGANNKKSSSGGDSGIIQESGGIKMHDDGRVTLQKERLYQQADDDSGDLVTQQQNKNSSEDNESVDSGLQTLRPTINGGQTTGPSFNDVVQQRSPVSKLPSRSGSLKSGERRRVPLDVSAPEPQEPSSPGLSDLSPSDSDARYDGVYYTREPLNNKPAHEFPTKTLDVDIDPISYKPHGNRPSAL